MFQDIVSGDGRLVYTGFTAQPLQFNNIWGVTKLHQVNIVHKVNCLAPLGLIESIKNIKQNIRENIVPCWFYETSMKILRLISKAPSPTFANLPPNSNVDTVKTNTVIY